MAETETYRFKGREDGLPVERLVLKGSTDNPEEWVDNDGIVDLTEDQLKDYKASGLKFTKLDPEAAQKARQTQIDSVSEAATRRGADQMDPAAVIAAKKVAEQNEASNAPSGSSDSSGDKAKQSGSGSGGKQS